MSDRRKLDTSPMLDAIIPDSAALAAVNTAPINGAPELDDEDPRARAARRAAELMEHWGGEQPAAVDDFSLAHITIPDGWEYEWRRLTVWNQPDPAYAVSLAVAGWEAVPTHRHPELMPTGHPLSEQITRRGQGLFERPKVVNDAARARDLRNARNQVRQKEEQLSAAPPGTFDRVDGRGAPTARVKHGIEPLPIPAK